jgi:hypothetical protein
VVAEDNMRKFVSDDETTHRSFYVQTELQESLDAVVGVRGYVGFDLHVGIDLGKA